MKTILFVCLLFLLCLLASCSGRQQASSEQAKLPVVQVSPVENKPTVEPVDPDAVAQDEANDYMKQWAAPRFAHCNGSIYWTEKYRGQQGVSAGQAFYECKTMQAPMVFGSLVPPRVLSDADRLNGIDPQPVEWDGKVDLFLHTCRVTYLGEKWRAWEDLVKREGILKRIKGKWKVDDISPNGINAMDVLKTDCAFVAKYLAAQHP